MPILRAVTDADEIAQLLHGARPPPLPQVPGQHLILAM